MLSSFNKNILTGILVLLLLNTYVFESEILNVLIGIAVFGIFIYSNRKVLKTLSLLEIIGMIVFIVAVISLLVAFFYFIAGPLINRITVGWLNLLVAIFIVIVILIPALGIIYKGMRVITKNKFPVMKTEIDDEDRKNYPKDKQIQQLASEGRTVEAVRLAREKYGYSLLKATDYIQYLKK